MARVYSEALDLQMPIGWCSILLINEVIGICLYDEKNQLSRMSRSSFSVTLLNLSLSLSLFEEIGAINFVLRHSAEDVDFGRSSRMFNHFEWQFFSLNSGG